MGTSLHPLLLLAFTYLTVGAVISGSAIAFGQWPPVQEVRAQAEESNFPGGWPGILLVVMLLWAPIVIVMWWQDRE